MLQYSDIVTERPDNPLQIFSTLWYLRHANCKHLYEDGKYGQLLNTMEDHWMSEETKFPCNHDTNVSISEVLFATLLGFTAVSSIWLSSTLLIHLYQSL